MKMRTLVLRFVEAHDAEQEQELVAAPAKTAKTAKTVVALGAKQELYEIRLQNGELQL